MRLLHNLDESGAQKFRDDSQEHNLELRSGGTSIEVNWTNKTGFEDCSFCLL